MFPSVELAAYSTKGDSNINLKMASDWSVVMNDDFQYSAFLGLTALGLGVIWFSLIAWLVYNKFWRVKAPSMPEVII